MQRALVEQAMGGDIDAYSELVKASHPRLFGIAHLILRDSDRAQDAVQDALLLAWRHVRSLRDPDAWDAWLRRLTVRACYKVARSAQAPDPGRAARDARPGIGQGAGRVGSVWSTVTGSDASWTGCDLDQRVVIVLHYYLDLPISEVAEIIDIPYGTAASRLHRGLEAMRASMRVATAGRRRPGHGATRMNEHIAFERFVADQFAERGSASLPARSVDDILTEARRMRPLPRWLATIKEPPMRISSRVAVGSPTARVAALAAATILLILLAAGAIVGGASLLAGRRARLVVDPDDPNAYQTISDAVAAAVDGDTVLVKPGTYPKSVAIRSDITVQGDGERGSVVVSVRGRRTHAARERGAVRLRHPARGQRRPRREPDHPGTSR